MRVCHTKAMKIVKELSEEKQSLIDEEDNNHTITYIEYEDKISNGYDYDKVRNKIREINDKVRKIKVELAISNDKTKIDEFDITIAEALILLAQLQSEREQLEYLADNVQLESKITSSGIIKYTECLFEVERVKKELNEIRTKINDIQIEIDKANLNTYIEI